MRAGHEAASRSHESPVMSQTWNESSARPESWSPDVPASLLFVNLAISVAAAVLLISGSWRNFHLGLLAFLLGLDGLLGQGASILLLVEPAVRAASCRIVALFAVLFLVLILGSLASLVAFPSPRLPAYLHIALPPSLALAVTLPFAFPQVAAARYIHHRYTCGFTNLTKAYSVVILVFGFVLPFSALVYFTYKNGFPLHWISQRISTSKSGKPVIFLVSLCSILLIPHIIQINITHFSSNVLKTRSDDEIIYTTAYDTFSIWLRYEFNVVAPIVIIVTLKDIRDEYKNLITICRNKTRFAKYVKSARENRTLKGKRFTPVLFVGSEGLMLSTNGYIRHADIPDSEEQSASKVESSTSTTATNSSRTPREKRNIANKKIVRFAHSVKEISWKDTNKWESSNEPSNERL